MPLARALFLAASKNTWLRDRFVRWPFARRAVRRFMPGERLDDALEAAGPLAARGIRTVITQLGENLTALAEADAVREHYLGAYDRIVERGLDCWPSVKPTQLGLDLSFDACLASLDVLAAKAAAARSMLWIDMEDSSYVDRTLDLYRRLKERHGPIGVCLQAYLRRTPADLEGLLPLRPAIRLVKGAYAEPASVAFPHKDATDEAYLALGQRMLREAELGRCFPVFGTHDVLLLRRLGDHAQRLDLPDAAWEIHMLYGIRSADQLALAAEGRAVRCLIAYGEHWFPWYMRRLAERPANVWFVLRSLLG